MDIQKTILGIDVGSVSAGMVLVDHRKNILHTGYIFHRGEITRAIEKLLAEVDTAEVDHLAATASTPSTILATKRYNNEICYIGAGKHLHPEMRGLLVVGGEKYSLARFDAKHNYLGSQTNSSCAAGTGSFLDQQASRLNLTGIVELSTMACSCQGSGPKIASRCAVFAKTDLIHAQQEGYGVDEISDGLCYGLAKNIVDTLFTTENSRRGEILFCGGVSKNTAVTEHIRRLSGASITISEFGHLYGALGACYLLLDEMSRQGDAVDETTANLPLRVTDIVKEAKSKHLDYYYPPLSLELSSYPDFTSYVRYTTGHEGEPAVEVDIYHPPGAGLIRVYLGIDIGSTSTKAVLMNEEQEVVAGLYTRTAGRPLAAVQSLFRAIEDTEHRYGQSFEVLACGTTGSGRKFVGSIISADLILDEITAHARAAYKLNPEVDTIVEIGGQDAKFTTLQNGRVTSSTMNTVCAAGTGSFIEEQAAKLGCAVTDYAGRAENVRAPMVSDCCTVFMERDINHYLARGYSVEEVLASALHAVRENYLQKVATLPHIGRTVLFQGATARNKALVAAFEQRLQKPILVSKFCHLTGALGTALILQQESIATSSFVGIDLHRRKVEISAEVCELCTNHCKLSVAKRNGSSVAYGFLCGRDYESKSYVQLETGAIDLLKERDRITRSASNQNHGVSPVVGIPAAVHLVEDLHLWRKFFDILGVSTLSSTKYHEALADGKKLSRAEFCAPVTAMHGYVDWLLKRADYLFMPIYLEQKAKDSRRQYCYYTQYLPVLTAAREKAEEQRFLRPVVKYLYTSFHTKMELYRMLQQVETRGWSFLEVSRAYDQAIRFKEACRQQMVELYNQRVNECDDIAVVFLGRPYSLLSPSLNGGIPTIFQKLGVDTFFQDMVEYEQDEVAALQPLMTELHWQHAADILEVAEVVAKRKHIYPVFLSSFMCSPDSFTLEYFKAIMDRHKKPYLILQLDEHDSSVGYETRIEAAIRSFRNHHQQRAPCSVVNYTTINPRLETKLERKHLIIPNWDRITCALLAATLKREGYTTHLIDETDLTLRECLKHNSGQCIPLNAVAQGYMETIRNKDLDPRECTVWLNYSSLACNIKLYPHHIKQILAENGMEEAGVYAGSITFAEISLRAAMNGYFAYMFGGILRKIACKIRPYEIIAGETDRVLDISIKLLSSAFEGRRDKEEALREIISRLEWIETRAQVRPKVALFGDLYVRDNRVINQDLIRYIEQNGGEVITTPYSEYAKMVARPYFRKWFNEGRYVDLLTNRTMLATMTLMERQYLRICSRILDEPEHDYGDDPAEILKKFAMTPVNTGESMDNILKIHYITKYYPDVSLFVQTSPALCCPSLVTEAMRERIEEQTGVPVVSVTYDGTGGDKNEVILPYLKYPRRVEVRADGVSGQPDTSAYLYSG